MSEHVLQPISRTNQPIHSQEEMVLQPLELSEAEKKRRAAVLLEESNVAVSGSENVAALPETAPATETAVAETTVAETAPVKAATVSSGKGTGLKVLGGALLLGGVGAAAAGGGSGGDDKPSEPTKPVKPTEPTKPVEPDLTAPVVSLNPLTHINQANQAQTFTLSGSLKADSTATQNTVAVMIGGKSHAATVSGNTWQLKISGSQLASKQGTQEILVTAVSMRGDKTVSSKTVSGSLNVDTQINTPEVSLNDVPNQLSTQQQTVTISGSLKNVDADATVQVRVKLNNGKEKIATVSGNTWKLDVSGSELVGKIGANRITATAIATDKSGNTAQHSDSDTFTVYQPTTIGIAYESGYVQFLSGSTETEFDIRSIKNSSKIYEHILHKEYKDTFGEDKIAANIQAAYGKDSDNDGVIDRNDKNPNTWDVSERDLRMFETLSYAKENEIKAIFTDKNQQQIASYNQKNYLNQADLNELINNWEVLKFHNGSDVPLLGTGLDYTIFGNGKKADGSYANVVIAFRGTTNAGDWLADANIGLGWIPSQAKATDRILKDLAKFNPDQIHITGHSLGGYNAQYFLSHYLINGKSPFADNVVHSALFNPAILKTRLFSRDILEQARATTDKLIKQQYIDDSDKTHSVTKNVTTSYVVQGDWVEDLLGHYDGTTWLDKAVGTHSLISFYSKHQQLENLFSKGYRVDKWYVDKDTDKDGLTDVQENRIGTNVQSETRIYGTDTDQDGFSDRLEIELGTDWTTAQKEIFLHENRKVEFALVTTRTDDTQELLSAQGVELVAQMDGTTLHYTPSGKVINLDVVSYDELLTWFSAGRKILSGSNGNDTLSGSDVVQIIYGGSGDDTLIAGSAQTVLVGGNGSDTFKFTASNLLSGSLNIISDLTAADKLDFSGSQSLFSQSSAFKWTSVLGDESLLAKNDAALIWQDDSNTLAYKAQGSSELHTFARFDDSQTLATLQAALIA